MRLARDCTLARVGSADPASETMHRPIIALPFERHDASFEQLFRHFDTGRRSGALAWADSRTLRAAAAAPAPAPSAARRQARCCKPSSSLLSFALSILAFAGKPDDPAVSAADLAIAARTLAIEVAAATAQTDAPRLKPVLNMRLSSIEHADATGRQRRSTASPLCLSVAHAKRI